MKKLKRVNLILLLLFSIMLSRVQAQQAATAAGGTATGTGGSATYTAGQVAYSFLSNANGSVGQGVQHAYEYLIGVDEMHQISVSMQVFPNPVSSILNVKIENENWKDMSYVLLDITGRVVQQKSISGPLTSISMENLDNADYFLTIRTNKEKIKTFKIIKNN